MEKFRLKLPEVEAPGKQPVVRLKASYYRTLVELRTKTGLTLGAITEQCIDYALENMEDDSYAG